MEYQESKSVVTGATENKILINGSMESPILKKQDKKTLKALKQMSEDYSFSWYECSGNHRERIWALSNSQVWCSSGHQMRKVGFVAPYTIFNHFKKTLISDQEKAEKNATI